MAPGKTLLLSCKVPYHQFIAFQAQTGNNPYSFGSGIGMLTDGFPGMDIGNMNLYEGYANSQKSVSDSNACMAVGSWVNQYTLNSVIYCRLNTIY